jgi:hypothetical protein
MWFLKLDSRLRGNDGFYGLRQFFTASGQLQLPGRKLLLPDKSFLRSPPV